jgi:uncharacterized protein
MTMRSKARHALLPMLFSFCAAALAVEQLPAQQQKSAEDSAKAAAEQLFPPVRERTLETRDIKSKGGRAYRIFVSKPAGAPPAGGFPIVYVLDANAWFGTTVEIVRLNEPASGPAVVVGIGYPTQALFDLPGRVFDYTPPLQPAEMGDFAALPSGGAAAFTRFLLDELRPLIERDIKVDRQRQAIFGHSLTGRFVVRLMFEQPGAFQAYLAASPSLHLGVPGLREAEDRFVPKVNRQSPPLVFMTAGMLEQYPDEDYRVKMLGMLKAHPEVLGGKSPEAALDEIVAESARLRMVDNPRELNERLVKAGISSKFVSYAGEDHMSVVPPSINAAVAFWMRGK